MSNNDQTIYNYQRGYADGYRRHHQHSNSIKNDDYYYTVFIIIIIFVIFILVSIWFYGSQVRESKFTGDCLLDFTSTYRTEGCF